MVVPLNIFAELFDFLLVAIGHVHPVIREAAGAGIFTALM
jgi:hypothetical protein